MTMTRRSWIGRVIAAAGLLILPAGAKAKKMVISIKGLGKLQKTGGWSVLKMGKKKVIVIRDSATSVKALDPYCTHKQCIVDYDPESKKIVCPCHSSIFDLSGKALKGPATLPLKSYKAKLDGDKVTLEVE